MNNTSDLPLIIAHRGASALAPENTLAAFRKAIEDGAEGIEFDVRLSKDGTAVVFHDADLKRIAGRDEKIIDLSFEELQKIDIGSWFNRVFPRLENEQFSNETIPTLQDVLDLLKDFRGLIYIELKCKEREVEPLAEAVCQGNQRVASFAKHNCQKFSSASNSRNSPLVSRRNNRRFVCAENYDDAPQGKASFKNRTGISRRSDFASLHTRFTQIYEKCGKEKFARHGLDG